MIRLMVFNNSTDAEGDIRTRWALSELKAIGAVRESRVIGFGEARTELRQSFLRIADDEVSSFRPDVLIWHKDDGRDLPKSLVETIASKTRLVYHDLDPWIRLIKPVQPNQKLLSRFAHLVYLCGKGSIADQFSVAGDKIRYSPHGYYDNDIPPFEPDKRHRLVFIGSIHRRFKRLLRRFGLEQHPGRCASVRLLQTRLGNRFEVYGNGYPTEWGIVPCQFDQQFEIINQSIASFALDAAPGAPGYFSNRTPISLACGSIHLKIRRDGDDVQFQGCPGLMPVVNANHAADLFQEISGYTSARLEEIAEETREFARLHFRQPDIYRTMLAETLES